MVDKVLVMVDWFGSIQGVTSSVVFIVGYLP